MLVVVILLLVVVVVVVVVETNFMANAVKPLAMKIHNPQIRNAIFYKVVVVVDLVSKLIKTLAM